MDFSKYFRKYEVLVKAADEVFERIKKEYPDCVTCEMKCSDCCHALFDLTLIEALYINAHFNERFKAEAREVIVEKANKIDRQTYRIKRKAYKELQSGKSEDIILGDLAEERVRCPLLNETNLCDLYEYRPLTCRFYGIPTAIGGKGHTCGLSGFDRGEKYATVNMDAIYQRLYQISAELIHDIGSKHVKMHELLVPVSMALLTEYDEIYLGIKDPEPEAKDNAHKMLKEIRKRRRV